MCNVLEYKDYKVVYKRFVIWELGKGRMGDQYKDALLSSLYVYIHAFDSDSYSLLYIYIYIY